MPIFSPYFHKGGSSRKATGSNYGPFFQPTTVIFHYISTIYWSYQHILVKFGHPGRPLGPIMGHFGAKNAIFSPYVDHSLKLSWLCCNCHKPRECKVVVGIPYNIFWQSGVIQAGHCAKLWAILEPKMTIFHHILTIYWSYLDVVATMTSPEHGRLV